jgi:hypothetical protein
LNYFTSFDEIKLYIHSSCNFGRYKIDFTQHTKMLHSKSGIVCKE